METSSRLAGTLVEISECLSKHDILAFYGHALNLILCRPLACVYTAWYKTGKSYPLVGRCTYERLTALFEQDNLRVWLGLFGKTYPYLEGGMDDNTNATHEYNPEVSRFYITASPSQGTGSTSLSRKDEFQRRKL